MAAMELVPLAISVATRCALGQPPAISVRAFRLIRMAGRAIFRKRRPHGVERICLPPTWARTGTDGVALFVLFFSTRLRARSGCKLQEETVSEGFTIANFRHVAKGLQEGQFAVGERRKAKGLADLDPIYKQLLDQPVTVTLGLIGPDGRINLTPMWFDYEGDKVLVNPPHTDPNANGFARTRASRSY
jgi:hypothetical protein